MDHFLSGKNIFVFLYLFTLACSTLPDRLSTKGNKNIIDIEELSHFQQAISSESLVTVRELCAGNFQFDSPPNSGEYFR